MKFAPYQKTTKMVLPSLFSLLQLSNSKSTHRYLPFSKLDLAYYLNQEKENIFQSRLASLQWLMIMMVVPPAHTTIWDIHHVSWSNSSQRPKRKNMRLCTRLLKEQNKLKFGLRRAMRSNDNTRQTASSVKQKHIKKLPSVALGLESWNYSTDSYLT